MSEWIPKKERLPDKDGRYLVTDTAGKVCTINVDTKKYYGFGSVVAWMPLPEPYKKR